MFSKFWKYTPVLENEDEIHGVFEKKNIFKNMHYRASMVVVRWEIHMRSKESYGEKNSSSMLPSQKYARQVLMEWTILKTEEWISKWHM